jgi:5-formyltetrahydrofolate cyclo-ligase
VITRIRTWLRQRADRRAHAEMIREADAALAARTAGNRIAYHRHAARALELSTRRIPDYEPVIEHPWRAEDCFVASHACPRCRTHYGRQQACDWCDLVATPVSNPAT